MSNLTPQEGTHPELDPEVRQWRFKIAVANRYNIFCCCRNCGQEWVASGTVACQCGSKEVEYLNCWQFPDD